MIESIREVHFEGGKGGVFNFKLRFEATNPFVANRVVRNCCVTQISSPHEFPDNTQLLLTNKNNPWSLQSSIPAQPVFNPSPTVPALVQITMLYSCLWTGLFDQEQSAVSPETRFDRRYLYAPLNAGRAGLP